MLGKIMTQKYISLTKLVLPFYDPVLTILDYTESRTSCGNSDGDSILKYFDYYIRRSCLSFLISWQKLFWENRKKSIEEIFFVWTREKKSFFYFVCVRLVLFFLLSILFLKLEVQINLFSFHIRKFKKHKKISCQF